MTRINLVEPKTLSVKHLVAEYREITRLPKNLAKSLSRPDFSITEIPVKYVLGKGHVKFFYNKMLFLRKRFESLVAEMLNRGYKPSYTDSSIFTKCPNEFYNDYEPSNEEIEINKARIAERS